MMFFDYAHPGCISIHALLAESDNRYGRPIDVQLVFLSTLSLRRATSQSWAKSTPEEISIHALLAESDNGFITRGQLPAPFLSTLSLRRATSQQPAGTTSTTYFYPRSPCGERLLNPFKTFIILTISIHALLAESDR